MLSPIGGTLRNWITSGGGSPLHIIDEPRSLVIGSWYFNGRLFGQKQQDVIDGRLYYLMAWLGIFSFWNRSCWYFVFMKQVHPGKCLLPKIKLQQNRCLFTSIEKYKGPYTTGKVYRQVYTRRWYRLSLYRKLSKVHNTVISFKSTVHVFQIESVKYVQYVHRAQLDAMHTTYSIW